MVKKTKMGKYIKLFNTEQEYTAFTQSQDYIEPNVSWVTGETEIVHYNPCVFEPPILSIGTVCYYNTSANHLKFTNISNYSASMGPAVGIVVVPNNCTPDGTVRIMAINGVTSGGTTAATEQHMKWSSVKVDTGLPNLYKIPTWLNNGEGTTGNSSYGYAPSDQFNQTACYGNNTVFYKGSTPYIPPILTQEGESNPNCLFEILYSGINVNALCDFDGPENTATLVALGSSYVAASACSMYSVDGLTSGWYLPACGELVYIVPKFTLLQSVLTAVGGTSLNNSTTYWCSSEYDSDNARYVGTGGGVDSYGKSYSNFNVRPFAKIELTPEYF